MGKQKRREFSEEFKREAVRRAQSSDQSYAQTSRELGIDPSLLQAWRQKFAAPREVLDKGASDEALQDEVRRLRRENASLKEDREILKKAAAFFAKESR